MSGWDDESSETPPTEEPAQARECADSGHDPTVAQDTEVGEQIETPATLGWAGKEKDVAEDTSFGQVDVSANLGWGGKEKD